MADTIPSHYTTQFSTNWIHRLNQKKSRLDAFIEFEDFDGERKRFDRINSMSAQLRTERKAPTRITDASDDSRWAYRKSYDLANLLDKDDAKNLGALVLPTSNYIAEHAAAYNRSVDDEALSVAISSVKTGELGTTNTAFVTASYYVNTADTVGAYSSGTSTGLTIAKLLKVREILDDADADEDAPRVLVCSSKQITDLLNTTQVTSADYNTVKALAAGMIDTFMGFKFIRMKRLTTTTENSVTARHCVAWIKGAIKMTRGSKTSKIDQRADLSYATQIYSEWHLGGVRVHDEGVVRIGCKEV